MNPKVAEIFRTIPEPCQKKLMRIRELIFSLSDNLDEMERIEESVKWGEPSYVTLTGSTVRLGWKAKDPHHYSVYFHCQTTLVETFRKIYPKQFHYEGNRAIVLGMDDDVDESALKRCILLALTYHKRKHLPLLGFEDF